MKSTYVKIALFALIVGLLSACGAPPTEAPAATSAPTDTATPATEAPTETSAATEAPTEPVATEAPATEAATQSTFSPDKLRGRETEGTITYTFAP